MASFKTYLLVKIMMIYNYLNDTYNNYSYKFWNFYDYISDYFSGSHDTWIFIPGHTLPLSINHLYNNCMAIWKYDNIKCLLELLRDEEDDDICIVKFSWLSATLRITSYENNETYQYEYDIDKFLEHLRIKTSMNSIPTLQTIYLLWCTYSKHWFPENSDINFIIIDDNGEEHTLSVQDNNNCLEIKHNKIYVVVDSGNDDDSSDVCLSSKLEPLETKNKDD
jgi:hypothetical protein